MRKGFVFLLIGFALLSSCGTNHLLENNLANANKSGQIKTAGKELSAGIDAQTLSRDLVKGLSDALDDSVFRNKLQNFISSTLTQTGSTTSQQIDSIKSILIAALDQITLQLSKSENKLLGDSLIAQIHKVKMELLGSETDALIAKIVESARDQLLNDSTRMKLGELRDELLGDRTNHLVSAIVDSAVATAVRRTSELKPQLSFIQKYATNILLVAGIVVAALIALGYWLRRKNLKYNSIINVITAEIEHSPQDVNVKDLKQRIQKMATDKNVETQLRSEFISKLNAQKSLQTQ